MFQRKTPKSQQIDKTMFTYHPVFTNKELPKLPEKFTVVSIDPAITNFGFRIEQRNSNGIITMIQYCRVNFTVKDETEGIAGIYARITDFLDKYQADYKKVDLILIERQLPFNYKAVRVSQHVITYFIMLYKNIINQEATIVEVDAKLKTKALCAPKGLNDREIKMWAVEEATRLLNKRKDDASLKILTKERKKDDLADTVCQIEAFCVVQGLPLTKELTTITIN